MQFVHFILALAPILWLMIALSVLKMPGYKACIITVIITAIESIAIWHFNPVYMLTAALEGALNALWPICLVIVAALFTYNLSLETGAMEKIKKMLAGVSTDQRVLALLIGWAFGHFMEGMAGFGTAVAIPAGILIALGMEPLPVVIGCLVVNSMPTAFGSVGVPTTTVSNITGLDVVKLSADTAKIELIIFVLLPFFLVFIVGKGFKAFKGMIGMIIVAAASFIIPMFIFATFVGPELPDIIGSICSMAAIVVFARMRKGEVPEEYRTKAASTAEGDSDALDVREAVVAWAPFLLIFVLLVLTSLVPFIKEPLSAIKSSFHIYAGNPDSKLSFTWINTPGVIIIISAVIGGLIQGASPETLLNVFVKTVRNNVKTIVTIMSVLATAKIMGYAGMTPDIAAFLVTATGKMFPLISPLIGTLGGFVTGSGTSTCVLFGPMQAETARAIGSDPSWLVAANTCGAGIGKMISPQGIAIGAASAGLTGSESKILSNVIKYCVVFVVIAGALCFALQ